MDLIRFLLLFEKSLKKSDMNKFCILFGGAAVICVWALWKLYSSELEKNQENEAHKKKRE